MQISSGKKLAILVLLAVSLATAVFFGKQPTAPEGTAVERPAARETFARRLPAPRAATMTPHGSQPQLLAPLEEPGLRVPTASTSSADVPAGSEFTANYNRSFHPAGAMLEPLADDLAPEQPAHEQQGAADDSGPALDSPALDPGPTRHVVVDGDTLTGLAARYLGSSDRYLEIFAANRSRLSNPDLLPIGAAIEIPPRRAPHAAGQPSAATPGPIPVVSVPALVPVQSPARSR